MTLHALEIPKAPAPGDELILANGQIELFGSHADERLKLVFKDLSKLVETFKPDLGPKGKIKTFETYITESGYPRFLLVALMQIEVPIIKSIKVTRTVRATTHVEPLDCQEGQRIVLDLADSDRDIVLQAEYVYLDLCVLKKSVNSVKIGYTARMIVGDDFGMRIAGKLAIDLLTRQIEPLLSELSLSFKN